jgi:hypothetical protein
VQDKKPLAAMSFKSAKPQSPQSKPANLISVPSSPNDSDDRDARDHEPLHGGLYWGQTTPSDQVPLAMLNSFQHTLFSMVRSRQFEDFLKLHNSIMIEVIEKEKSRDDLLKQILKETAEVQRENSFLQVENAKLKGLVQRKES